MGLFGPVWDTSNPRKRDKAIASVNRIDDDAELLEIATNAQLVEVAVAAVNRISDPAVLASVFRKGNGNIVDESGKPDRRNGPTRVRKAAAQRLDDDDLAALAREGGGLSSSEALVECLSSHSSALAEIAENERWNLDARLCALEKIAEPNPITVYALLEKVYPIQDTSYERYKGLREVIKRAMLKVTDHEALTAYLLGGGTTHELYWEWRNPLADMMGIMTKNELTSIVTATSRASGAEVAWEKLEPLLSDDELIAFACDSNFKYRERACERVGHERGERCLCVRCGKQLDHEVEGDSCKHCGGRVSIEVEPGEWERVYSNFEIYDDNGRKVANPRTRQVYTRTYLCHEDGTRLLLDETSKEERSW